MTILYLLAGLMAYFYVAGMTFKRLQSASQRKCICKGEGKCVNDKDHSFVPAAAAMFWFIGLPAHYGALHADKEGREKAKVQAKLEAAELETRLAKEEDRRRQIESDSLDREIAAMERRNKHKEIDAA